MLPGRPAQAVRLRPRARALVVLFALMSAGLVAGTGAQSPRSDVSATLELVGERVEAWYARAQSLVSLESGSIEPLRGDLTSADVPRRLTYELRVAWEAPAADAGGLPEASVVRELLTVHGRAPRAKDEPQCLDPKGVSPEPLNMLLPGKREEYSFSRAGTTRVEGRTALMLDYRSIAPGQADITWDKDCVSISLPGRSRGRVWIDAETYDVLRLDEHLVGMFDFDVPREHRKPGVPRYMTVERADSSIRYKRVAFQDPEETLMLPSVIDTVTIVRSGSAQRYRVTQRFSGYRRFLTGGRIVD